MGEASARDCGGLGPGGDGGARYCARTPRLCEVAVTVPSHGEAVRLSHRRSTESLMRPARTETDNAQHQHSEHGDIQQRVKHIPPKRIAVCGY